MLAPPELNLLCGILTFFSLAKAQKGKVRRLDQILTSRSHPTRLFKRKVIILQEVRVSRSGENQAPDGLMLRGLFSRGE